MTRQHVSLLEQVGATVVVVSILGAIVVLWQKTRDIGRLEDKQNQSIEMQVKTHDELKSLVRHGRDLSNSVKNLAEQNRESREDREKIKKGQQQNQKEIDQLKSEIKEKPGPP